MNDANDMPEHMGVRLFYLQVAAWSASAMLIIHLICHALLWYSTCQLVMNGEKTSGRCEMIVKHQETVAREVCICDFCLAEMPGEVQCEGCGKHVCQKCGTHWFFDPWTGDSIDDMWVRACKRCHSLTDELRGDARKARETYEAEIERIEADWKRRCLDGGE